MKKNNNFIYLISVIFLGNLFFAPLTYAAESGKNKVVATYNGEKVTEEQINQFFRDIQINLQGYRGQVNEADIRDFSSLETKDKKDMIEHYINDKLIRAEASKKVAEFSKSAEFKKNLAEMKNYLLGQEFVGLVTGENKKIENKNIKEKYEALVNEITKTEHFKKLYDEASNSLVQRELIKVNAINKVTDEEVSKRYQQKVKEAKGKKERKVAHILVRTEEEAQDISKQLKKNADFEKLAKKLSQDQSSANDGGVIQVYLNKDKPMMAENFHNKVFTLKQGEISDPVKTDFGWHIIKMIDERDLEVPPMENIKDELKRELQSEMIKKYFDELNSKANIKINI